MRFLERFGGSSEALKNLLPPLTPERQELRRQRLLILRSAIIQQIERLNSLHPSARAYCERKWGYLVGGPINPNPTELQLYLNRLRQTERDWPQIVADSQK